MFATLFLLSSVRQAPFAVSNPAFTIFFNFFLMSLLDFTCLGFTSTRIITNSFLGLHY
jgi:hypothetical protein